MSMTITAQMVKELRERTNAAMMQCKQALVECQGNLDEAADYLRKTGIAKADKKADRIAAEGTVVVRLAADNKSGVVVEINCETDFVARDENFVAFSQRIADIALANHTANVETLSAATYEAGVTIEEARKALIAKIGENIQIRRVELLTTAGQLGYYLHGGRIAVVVDLAKGDTVLAKDLAMHIAASNPIVVRPDQVDQALIEKEREIFSAQAKESGKPSDIIEKMIVGRINKYLAEVSLLGQPYVKDPNITVEQLLKNQQAEVTRFVRYAVGEGIEKKEDNFVEEVMAQAKAHE